MVPIAPRVLAPTGVPYGAQPPGPTYPNVIPISRQPAARGRGTIQIVKHDGHDGWQDFIERLPDASANPQLAGLTEALVPDEEALLQYPEMAPPQMVSEGDAHLDPHQDAYGGRALPSTPAEAIASRMDKSSPQPPKAG